MGKNRQLGIFKKKMDKRSKEKDRLKGARHGRQRIRKIDESLETDFQKNRFHYQESRPSAQNVRTIGKRTEKEIKAKSIKDKEIDISLRTLIDSSNLVRRQGDP